MQFTLMVYEDEKNFQMRTNPDDHEKYWEGTISYLQALHQAGIFIGGAGLEKPTLAKTVRFHEGKVAVKNSTGFTNSYQLGGYFMIDVNNHDEAIKWASKFPQRPGIRIEVRSNLTNKK